MCVSKTKHQKKKKKTNATEDHIVFIIEYAESASKREEKFCSKFNNKFNKWKCNRLEIDKVEWFVFTISFVFKFSYALQKRTKQNKNKCRSDK